MKTLSRVRVRSLPNRKGLCHIAIVVACLGTTACTGDPGQSTVTVETEVLSKDDLSTAVRVYKEALLWERQGYYQRAIDTLRWAVPVFYEHGASEWTARALLVWSEASGYHGTSDHVEDSLFVAKSIIKDISDEDLEEELDLQFALHYLLNGDYTRAHQRVMGITERESSKNSRVHIRASCMLGWIARGRGQYHNSIQLLENTIARTTTTSAEDSLSLSFCENQLSLAYWHKGAIRDAEIFVRKSIQHRRDILGPGSPRVTAALANLGIILYTKGDYLEALALFESNVTNESQEPRASETLARAYSNIGLVHWKIGSARRAIEFLKRAESIRYSLKGPSHPGLHIVYNRLGLAYYDLGDYSASLSYHARSLSLKRRLGPRHPELAHALTNAGLTLFELGRVDEALDHHKRALRIRQIENPAHPDAAMDHENIARAYQHKTEFDFALNHFNIALHIYSESEVRRRENVARVYMELSRLYSRRGEESMSASCLDSVIAQVPDGTSRRWPSSYPLMKALHQKGKILASDSSLVSTIRAIEFYGRAVDELDRLASHPTLDQSTAILSTDGMALLADAFAASVKMFRMSASTVDHDRLFRFSNQARQYSARGKAVPGKHFLDTIADSIVLRQRGLRARIRELELSLYPRPDSLQISDELFHARREYDRFLLYLSRTYPAYYEFQHANASLSASDVAASLDADEALIEFFETRDSVYVIGISKEARSVHAVETDRIGRTVSMYLDGIRNRKPMEYLKASYTLYQELLQPAEDLIADKDLTIVPDGQLHFLPFEPLLTSPVDIAERPTVGYHNLPYLVTKHTIEYAYSASLRDFVRGREYPAWESDFLGVAPAFKDVTYSWPQVPMKKVNYLPGTVHEVQSIYNMFVPWFDVLNGSWRSRSTVLIGSNATEEKLRSLDLTQYRFLHFATHGSVTEDNPSISGLLLHPGSRNHDDVLRLGEIYGMRLSADLVVLSACDTGRGRVVDGEGVIGLTGGFLYAGARNVMVSLWPVEDKSAAELMRRFYASSLRHSGFQESLRQAKIDMINSGGEYSRPYHWAGYVLFGN